MIKSAVNNILCMQKNWVYTVLRKLSTLRVYSISGPQLSSISQKKHKIVTCKVTWRRLMQQFI